jgi:hypothetical protein
MKHQQADHSHGDAVVRRVRGAVTRRHCGWKCGDAEAWWGFGGELGLDTN